MCTKYDIIVYLFIFENVRLFIYLFCFAFFVYYFVTCFRPRFVAILSPHIISGIITVVGSAHKHEVVVLRARASSSNRRINSLCNESRGICCYFSLWRACNGMGRHCSNRNRVQEPTRNHYVSNDIR